MMRSRYNHIGLKAVFILLLCCCQFKLSAQAIRLMRYDEDYSNLKDSSRTFYNRIKCLVFERTTQKR